MKQIISSIASIVLGLLFVGCSSTGTGTSATTGTLKVHLTDAPSCGYKHVYVTVDHIEISTDGSVWTTIAVDPGVAQPIDLLNLTNGAMLTLGEAPLSAGTYQQVRLVLAANTGSGPAYANAVVLNTSSTQLPLTTPSAQQSGYKILGPITVEAGTLSDLVLDFNACKSIVSAGQSGKYILKPVVTATAQVVSGTISGFALAGSQVSAYLEPDGTFITGTVVPAGSAATGQFNLGPILQTSATSSIDVVIVPPADAAQATIIVQGVPVVASTTTWISPTDGSVPFNVNDATLSIDTTATINTVSGVVTVASVLGQANVVASQTITSTGRSYEIGAVTSAAVTGVYSLSVAESGPWLATYSATLPLTLTQDQDLADAGKYSVAASTALSTSAPVAVDASAGSVTNVDFTLTQ